METGERLILLGSCCLAVLGVIFLPAVIADTLLQRIKRNMERREW